MLKTCGYDSCYKAIMSAKLDKPIYCPGFTIWFDGELLTEIRDLYGVDLYKECLKDAEKFMEESAKRTREGKVK